MTYHVLVQFDVPPHKRDDFVAAGLFDAEGSLTHESGTLRFEVIRDEDNPNRIYLDEVYASRGRLKSTATTRPSRSSTPWSTRTPSAPTSCSRDTAKSRKLPDAGFTCLTAIKQSQLPCNRGQQTYNELHWQPSPPATHAQHRHTSPIAPKPMPATGREVAS